MYLTIKNNRKFIKLKHYSIFFELNFRLTNCLPANSQRNYNNRLQKTSGQDHWNRNENSLYGQRNTVNERHMNNDYNSEEYKRMVQQNRINLRKGIENKINKRIKMATPGWQMKLTKWVSVVNELVNIIHPMQLLKSFSA